MNHHVLIDSFIAAKRLENRMSQRSEDAYRPVLALFLSGLEDPAAAGKRDVQAFIARYDKPATRAHRRAILRSFYQWMTFEGMVPFNVVDQVPPIRYGKPDVTRLTRTEILRLLNAAEPVRRDRWAVWLMLYGGLRNAELRGLRGRDLARHGWIHVVEGKGKKNRWVPVTGELEPIVQEIVQLTRPDDFVLPGRRWAKPNTVQVEKGHAMLSSSALRRQVMRVADRAGLASHVTPHTLRHAFAEQAVRLAGVKLASQMLGHADVGTTVNTYTGAASLDELAVAMTGFAYRSLPVAEPKEASDGR